MIRHGIEELRERLDLDEPYVLEIWCDDDSHWPAFVDAFILTAGSDDWELVDDDARAALAGEVGMLGRPLKRSRTARFVKVGGVTQLFYKPRCATCRRHLTQAPADKLHPILDTLALADRHRIPLVGLEGRVRNASTRNRR